MDVAEWFRVTLRFAFALSFALLLACSDDDLPIFDAGPAPDVSGTIDAATPFDAGAEDAARTDADSLDAATSDAGPDGSADGGGSCPLVEPEVVTFETDDGVLLEADLYAAPSGAPPVVLVHMIPPTVNRRSWPRAMFVSLMSRCFTVLNFDRRGAGESGGVAVDAYEGPGGALDVKAAVAFLGGHESAPDMTRLVTLGASNGTTSVNDYASLEELEYPPAAAVLLSVGPYTVNQNPLFEGGLATVPTLFLYPDAEAELNESVETDERLPPDMLWSFANHTSSAHGTALMNNAGALDELVAYLEAQAGL